VQGPPWLGIQCIQRGTCKVYLNSATRCMELDEASVGTRKNPEIEGWRETCPGQVATKAAMSAVGNQLDGRLVVFQSARPQGA
jgi:hypothetical protein